MVRQVVFENRGAGLYGGTPPTHKTKCPQSNNPHGHSKECACGWWAEARASQVTPYEEVPDGGV